MPDQAPALRRHDACALSGDLTPAPDTLTLALSGTVDLRHAPIPQSEAERFVFRELFETLIHLDCTGQVRPSLAESWRPDDAGRRWSFTLRADATFWDGLPVTTRDVIASWVARDTTIQFLAPWDGLLADAIAAESDRVLSVRLTKPSATVPLIFTDAALAVVRPVAGRDWLVGTGDYAADASGGRVIVAPVRGGRRPVIVLRSNGAGDARDLLDAGVDLLVTDDPSALSYAAGRPDLTSAPLPWDRTYVLLAPNGVAPLPDSARAGLARDAVRVDAWPAMEPSWWSDFTTCHLEPPPGTVMPSPGVPLGTMVYPQDDRPARDLAERLVALAVGGATAPARAIGLPAADFAAALASARCGRGQLRSVATKPSASASWSAPSTR